jgi:hypothetical protein
VPALILTSDQADMEQLLDGAPETGRIAVVGV